MAIRTSDVLVLRNQHWDSSAERAARGQLPNVSGGLDSGDTYSAKAAQENPASRGMTSNQPRPDSDRWSSHSRDTPQNHNDSLIPPRGWLGPALSARTATTRPGPGTTSEDGHRQHDTVPPVGAMAHHDFGLASRFNTHVAMSAGQPDFEHPIELSTT